MLSINAEIRKLKGTNISNKLRKNGYILCIIYEKYKKSFSIMFKENIFKNFINKNNFNKQIYNIIIESVNIIVKIKNIQYHPFKNKILHIDFIKI